MIQPLGRSDFIVMGGRYGDKVLLLAAKDLNFVELEERYELDHLYSFGHNSPIGSDLNNHKVSLTARLRHYVSVYEDSYPQAWQALHKLDGMDGWSLWNDGWSGL